eukprot:jgi/Picre1/31743/NNA_007094.t1
MVKTEESSKGMVDVVEEQLKALTNVFEGGLASASDALKSSTATAKNEASKAMGVLEIAYSHFFYALDTADRMVITTLKKGCVWVGAPRGIVCGLAGLVLSWFLEQGGPSGGQRLEVGCLGDAGVRSRVHRSERNAKNVLYEIRNIRSKHALQLRSDAAVVVESASKQAKQVEKIVGKLDKHGL